MPEKEVQLLPKQMQFYNCAKKEVLYSGAFGAGKSRALCYKLLERARIKDNTVGLCRKTLVALRGSTLRTLLFPDGDLPPVLPPRTYTWLKSEQRIELHDGGNIVYFGCDDPIKVGSMHGIGSIFVDEATELDEEEWTMLLGRCRNNIDDRRQLCAATNPGNPSHFLYKRFFGDRRHPMRKLIITKSIDNFFLPPDYIDMLNTFTGPHKRRYVDGEWVAFEGLVYGDVWDRTIHLQRRPPNMKWQQTIVGVDDGYTNPACVCKWGLDRSGRLHAREVFYKRKQLQSQIIEKCVEMHGDVYVVDPAAASLIAGLEEEGLYVVPADNDIIKGLRLTMERFKVQKDKRPRITFEPTHSDAILELESYSWDKEKDIPLKEMDHFCDQMRYVCNYVDGDFIFPGVHDLEDGDGRRIKRVTQLLPEDERVLAMMEDEEAWTNHE